MNGRIGKGDPLTSLKHRAHGFCRHRCPASVFNKTYRASAEAALGKMLYKFAHKRENSGVVCGSGKHQLAEAEGIRHGAGHIRAGKVIHHKLRTALGAQHIAQLFDSLFCVPVHRGVGYDNALLLGGIGRPCAVKPDVMSEILAQHRTVQGADL